MIKATIEITLDDTWEDYLQMDKEFLIEDLFNGLQEKDGVGNVNLVNLEKF